MTHYSRLLLSLAAICITAAMWTVTPALAADDAASVSAAAKSAKTSLAPRDVIKRHASRRTHVAVAHYIRRVSLAGNSPECSGVWCGRQFVLIIGIGF